ncbi:MAG TPA: Crp/Fnr family transcriptional regulator [Alphaproteobacteria bacterium]|nr:Crp/Fnr family transcriptional regulator [Alphaproteobacteria bacterium]
MTLSKDKAPSFKHVSLFESLPDKVREGYEHACAWRRFARDEQIIDRLSDTHEVFFIVEGAVRIVNHSLSGREISFDDLHAGEFFGEIAAIDGKPRSATVVALSETLLAIMPAEVFRRLVTEHPALALTIMRRLAKIIRASTGRIMDLSTLAAQDRVRAEIVRLARAGLGGNGTARISPIPIHADIASRVSTTRETVARVLGSLTRRGLVKREHDALVVTDFARLEQSVEELTDVEE